MKGTLNLSDQLLYPIVSLSVSYFEEEKILERLIGSNKEVKVNFAFCGKGRRYYFFTFAPLFDHFFQDQPIEYGFCFRVSGHFETINSPTWGLCQSAVSCRLASNAEPKGVGFWVLMFYF